MHIKYISNTGSKVLKKKYKSVGGPRSGALSVDHQEQEASNLQQTVFIGADTPVLAPQWVQKSKQVLVWKKADNLINTSEIKYESFCEEHLRNKDYYREVSQNFLCRYIWN